MQTALVRSLGLAMVAVRSLDEGARAWEELAFEFGPVCGRHGCRVRETRFGQGGVLLVAPEAGSARSRLAQSVVRRLEGDGEGFFGWTWLCEDLELAARRLGGRATASDGGYVIDSELTPGVTTLLEEVARDGKNEESVGEAANGVSGIDHVVLATGDVDGTAAAYEHGFGLSRRTKEMKGQLFAFLKVGGPVIEIVGPAERIESMPTRPWGLALRSRDLDRTVEAIGRAGGRVSEARPAIQGGRIASAKDDPNGVPLAFLGA